MHKNSRFTFKRTAFICRSDNPKRQPRADGSRCRKKTREWRLSLREGRARSLGSWEALEKEGGLVLLTSEALLVTLVGNDRREEEGRVSGPV